jgi:hypothetical protein
MPQTAPLTVVATQLALTDRRALSEAWYSALHAAGPPRRDALARGPAVAPRRAPGRLTGPLVQAHERALEARVPLVSRAHVARVTRAEHVPERRAPQSALARRLQRAIVRRIRRGLPGSFAMRAGEGRVQILVRSDGSATRIVAICAPPLRARVERALAQARFALAAYGVRCEVRP